LDTDAMGEDGAAVLEVVEASGNAGEVEGAVGVEGAVALGGCEPVEVGARQAVMRGWSSRACEAAAVPAAARLGAHAALLVRQPLGDGGRNRQRTA
jgi:hypothetical protein